MPIVNHITEQSAQANGGANVTIRMYDQDAQEYTQAFYAPPDFDIAGKVAATIGELNVQLAENEFRALVGL